jgi:acetate kinase
MSDKARARILAVNTGSSSLKAALFRIDAPDQPSLGVLVDRIGAHEPKLRVSDGRGETLAERAIVAPDFERALDVLLQTFDAYDPGHRLAGIGHRLVHGGLVFDRPQTITAEALAQLDGLARLAPEHMPQALIAVRFFARSHPGVTQAGCFDTSFHRTMPRVAQLIPLPKRERDAGRVRFGFHGLSYESLIDALRQEDPVAARGRIVAAHLGNGASMTAINEGASVDTTMGYTPTSGLVMGTRCGDIDPGIVLDLIERDRMTPDAVNTLLNKQSGLLGLSGTSRDMRDLLAAEGSDARAADAIGLFCYRARKYVGAFASVLGGIDTLVFTGGIGERAPAIRERICAGHGYLGITLDPEANRANAPIISARGSRVGVRIVRANEEGVIVRHTLALIAARAHAAEAARAH